MRHIAATFLARAFALGVECSVEVIVADISTRRDGGVQLRRAARRKPGFALDQTSPPDDLAGRAAATADRGFDEPFPALTQRDVHGGSFLPFEDRKSITRTAQEMA